MRIKLVENECLLSNPNDQNTRYHVLVAVNNTKTKF